MGEPMNYDTYAEHYAYAREAFPWIVTPLARAVLQLPANATVVEIGRGTGNYIIALADAIPDYITKASTGYVLWEPAVGDCRRRPGGGP